MGLLTAAAIVVRKAIAKSAFEFWVKDSEPGTDISFDLLDLIRLKNIGHTCPAQRESPI